MCRLGGAGAADLGGVEDGWGTGDGAMAAIYKRSVCIIKARDPELAAEGSADEDEVELIVVQMWSL